MRSAYRYLSALLVVEVALQLVLAALGAFRAEGGKPARDQSVFDPHRINGDVVIVIALLLLLSAIAARDGRWRRFPLILFVLVVIQNPLAHAGTVGGVLHGLNAFLILGLAIELARGAWARRTIPA